MKTGVGGNGLRKLLPFYVNALKLNSSVCNSRRSSRIKCVCDEWCLLVGVAVAFVEWLAFIRQFYYMHNLPVQSVVGEHYRLRCSSCKQCFRWLVAVIKREVICEVRGCCSYVATCNYSVEMVTISNVHIAFSTKSREYRANAYAVFSICINNYYFLHTKKKKRLIKFEPD